MLQIFLVGIIAMTAAVVDGLSHQIDTHSLTVNDVGPVAASGSGGYEAVNDSGRRKTGPSRMTSEDAILQTGKRDKLQATTADLVRNFSIAGWMIRRHLDFVALFDYQSQCAKHEGLVSRYGAEAMERLDHDVERLMAEDSKRRAMDAGRRFSREKFFRIAEAQRVIGGDVALVKLKDGRLQGIESDLLRNPDNRDRRRHKIRKSENWTDGVQTGAAGRHLSYAIHRRKKGGRGYEVSRIVPAKNVIHYGFFSRFASDQTRGVSPVAAGLNHLVDCYEGMDYALGKLKVSQLFALAIFSESMNATGEVGVDSESTDEDGNTKKRYNVDFGEGPVHLELDEGDRAEFLESKTPSIETQQFCNLVIGVALKSLDIPYSFYDEAHTNFFGSRAAWLHYERAAIDKRNDQIEARQEYEIWKKRHWVMSGRLILPAGLSLAELSSEWVPLGMPWWDPSKEIRGDKAAVSAGFDNPERIVKRTGKGSVYDNLVTTMRVMQFARKKSAEILGDPDAFVPNFGAPAVVVTNKGEDEEE